MSDASGIIVSVVVLAVCLFGGWYFGLRGLFVIKDSQIGILTRKFTGKKMPQGQVIARDGQIGIQAETLLPGLYYRFPLIWSVKRVPITDIETNEIGLVESIDGSQLPKGRLLANEVDCNSFQDAEKFYANGGSKGPQVGILKPGRYRINTLAFIITKSPATVIGSNKVGILTAQDGTPLPSNLIIAPKPTAPTNYFQDAQSFLNANGYRGPQLDTLQPGQYYLNTKLFAVEIVDNYEVPPGFVAILRSNVGAELEQPKGTPVSSVSSPDELINEAQSLLKTDKDTRGIFEEPIAPGTYNLNTIAYTAYPVTTSAIMIDWASSDGPNVAKMARPSASPISNQSDYPYVTEESKKGEIYFKFSQLEVTSKDGFIFPVDVRMVIRILPRNAAFVIARFGSVFNLIQQIVHPLIDSSFRNNAGQKNALEFVQTRTELQKEALEEAKKEFEKYHVEAQNLLISFIGVPQELLDTQTKKQIAQQQQIQYQQQALAEEQRIAVQEKTARANKQPEVVQAALQVEINRNNASAAVEQAKGLQQSKIIAAEGTKQSAILEAEGTRQSTILQAQGDRESKILNAQGNAEQVLKVGNATAEAYKAQAEVLGAERLTAVQMMDRIRDGRIVITPQIAVTSGDKEGSTSSTLTAYLATLLSQTPQAKVPPPAVTSEKQNKDKAAGTA